MRAAGTPVLRAAVPGAGSRGGLGPFPSVGEVVRELEQLLARAGIETARLEAELLVGDVLGFDRGRVYVLWSSPCPPEAAAAARELAVRRSSRLPLQYLRGVQEFFSRPFLVTPSVLIPRPETEVLVSRALELAGPPHEPRRVLDACTGSGCIAVTWVKERPSDEVWATDLSPAALLVARENARRHSVRPHLVACDLLAAFRPSFRFDLVVSNPPYLPESMRTSLAPEVALHEPLAALFSGPDGLDVIRRLVEQSVRLLHPGGVLCLEMGPEQAGAIRGLAESAGFEQIVVHDDLADRPRVLTARRLAVRPQGIASKET
ncbi:MAG: peptide chain release factor N(5)-glutamine methyltransferase [Candidatus Riflebacteria bacterium]|nr:peptide chain release factor N(5)-glutamine methyltransferase [Candidatus Riflebacteria bacterium]